ncbi:MAG: hypothetical protein K6E73_09195, partial [Bacteroidales bacterium]|nr:hypothetical protein [Bacteroidales bacterium]
PKAIFFILGRIFRPCPQAQCHIAPSAKTEICIPISEKYSQIILNTYLQLKTDIYELQSDLFVARPEIGT